MRISSEWPVRRGWLAAMTAAAATLTLTTASAGTAIAAAAAAAPVAAVTTAAPSGIVLLLNGDRIRVRPGPGGQIVTEGLAAPGSGGLLSLREGSHAYEIPDFALPYLGHGLNISLFELSELAKTETGGRLRIVASYTGKRPSLPGVTFTSYGPGRARGYLTASSARRFGAALERQYRADHGRDSYGTDGLFARGLTIAVTGAPAAARQRPAASPAGTVRHAARHRALSPLTVRGTGPAGHADTGDSVFVINAGNWHTFGDPIETSSVFYHGEARYAVPAGHYWAVANFFTFSKTGYADRLVVRPQFTVRGATTVGLAARSATSPVTSVTPRPAVPYMTNLSIFRGGQDHSQTSVSSLDVGGTLLISPTTTRPTVGTLRTYTQEALASPAGTAGVPYAYNLDFAGPAGIIADQHRIVTAASLATVHERYYQDVKTTGAVYTWGGAARQWAGTTWSFPTLVTMPGRQTQYMTGGSDTIWQTFYWPIGQSFGGQTDAYRTLLRGQQLTENWNRYPLHPQPAGQFLTASQVQMQPGLFGLPPSAVRAGNRLLIEPSVFSDNQPGHLGPGYQNNGGGATVTASYALYQNGKEVAHGSPVQANSIAPITVGAKPSTLTFVLSVARRGRYYVLSPASTTTWTWRSARRPGARLPAPWICEYDRTSRDCAAQPLLSLDYHVQGLALDGQAPAGKQTIGLTVGHFAPAAGSKITGAGARVSWNGGKRWHPATVTATGSGKYRITFTAPAGAAVTLHVSATDAAGGSISETIQHAYGVTK